MEERVVEEGAMADNEKDKSEQQWPGPTSPPADDDGTETTGTDTTGTETTGTDTTSTGGEGSSTPKEAQQWPGPTTPDPSSGS